MLVLIHVRKAELAGYLGNIGLNNRRGHMALIVSCKNIADTIETLRQITKAIESVGSR
jgi:uncharacterized protein YcfJ